MRNESDHSSGIQLVTNRCVVLNVPTTALSVAAAQHV